MENKTINMAIVSQVATALKELNKDMVYVGGAVISVYADDPAADEVRPTTDIDLTVDLAGFAAWTYMQERLANLGFSPDPQETVICRYKYENIQVDIMPATDSPIGPTNPWYKPGFDALQNYELETGSVIRILSAPYFLATKFAAFYGRGEDHRTSHDFEDIIYIIDNRTTIVEEILQADELVKSFLQLEFEKLINNKYKNEIISAQISPIISGGRLPIILEKLSLIVSG